MQNSPVQAFHFRQILLLCQRPRASEGRSKCHGLFFLRQMKKDQNMSKNVKGYEKYQKMFFKCFRNIMSSEFWPSLSRGDVSHLCFCDSHHATNLQSESTAFPSKHFSGRILFSGIVKAFRIFVSICSVRPTFPTPTLLLCSGAFFANTSPCYFAVLRLKRMSNSCRL